MAAPDVGRMGIEILSFTIKDVYDNVQYLASLGRAQTANVKRDADVGVAEANRDAGIRVSAYWETSIQWPLNYVVSQDRWPLMTGKINMHIMRVNPIHMLSIHTSFFWFIFNDWFWRLIPGICKFNAGLSSLILAGCRVNTIEGDLYSPNERLSWKPMHIEGLIITWNYFFQEAECEKIRMDAKFEADTKIADSSRAYLMQKANFDMEVNAKVGENDIRLYKNRIKPPYNMVIFLSIRLYGNLFIKYILTKDS